jgi:hypothetical protein
MKPVDGRVASIESALHSCMDRPSALLLLLLLLRPRKPQVPHALTSIDFDDGRVGDTATMIRRAAEADADDRCACLRWMRWASVCNAALQLERTDSHCSLGGLPRLQCADVQHASLPLFSLTEGHARLPEHGPESSGISKMPAAMLRIQTQGVSSFLTIATRLPLRRIRRIGAHIVGKPGPFAVERSASRPRHIERTMYRTYVSLCACCPAFILVDAR